MRILGLLMIHNSAPFLAQTLTAMSAYCDHIFILDDRSIDSSVEIARSFPKVANIFSANNSLPQVAWYFRENLMYELLYRMADFYQPDWIIQLDDDEYIETASGLRGLLAVTTPQVSCIKFPKVSLWNDARYPQLVPLMGSATNRSGAVWRYFPGLQPHGKPLHNPRFPANIELFGESRLSDDIRFIHRGWDTLDKRIQAVDKYSLLDPTFEFNQGIPYDTGLLFGYKRNEIDKLINVYREKYATALLHDNRQMH
jgi:glycosyltransferase involved in cell wall biosynthesis